MIVRTPPPKRSRAETRAIHNSPNPDRGLVIYEDAAPAVPASSHDASEQMLCTYQCRQMVKAELLDALDKAERQVVDYQSKVMDMNENFCKSESQRKKLQDKSYYVEQELAATKGREQVLQEQLLKEVNDNKERLKKQIQSCSELELKLKNEMNLRQNAESSAASAEEKVSLLEDKLSHLSQNFEREKKRFHNEIAQLKSDSKLTISRISANLERTECRANNAERESELLKDQLEVLKKQLNECLHEKNEVNKKLSSFTCQETAPTGSDILVKQLQEELRSYESEVREARKLRSSHENIELLKEKLLEEKFCRERAESDLLKLPELQQNMKKLEDELSSWKSLIKDIPDVSCSEDIPHKLGALQKEVIDSMMKLGEANACLKQMNVALEAAEISKRNVEAESALCKEHEKASKMEAKQSELMLSMVTEERDQLRNLVDELKKQMNVGGGGNGDANGTIIQELESSLAKRELSIKELDSNLSEQKKVNARQNTEIMLLTEKLNNEARRIKSLERESDQLRSEISLLESKLGHGDFSTANTKVLRMVNTLAIDSEAKQTIEALQLELLKTKEKLQAVEELKSQSGYSADDGKLVDSYISGKIVQLREQIATLEKREGRYKTVFADKISVFRKACCELFGYKILMDDHQRPNGIPVTHFTLQSIYAQSDDEKFEFEYESENANILANDYTSQPEISRQVDVYIRRWNSIPAFTANLTMESFQRRTLS